MTLSISSIFIRRVTVLILAAWVALGVPVFAARMLQGAEKAHWSENLIVMDKISGDLNATSRKAGYVMGYTFGYVGEQVAVGYYTGGTIKIGSVMAKGGFRVAEAFAARRTLPVVARLHLVKKWAASAAVSAELKIAVERGLVKAAEVPVTNTLIESPLEVLEQTMVRATYNRVQYATKHFVADLVDRPNLRKMMLIPGAEELLIRRAGQLATIMGDDCTDIVLKNFMKVSDEVILVPRADDSVDEFFEAFFRAFTGNPSQLAHADDPFYSLSALPANGKEALKRFLSDPNPGKMWDTFEETTFFNNRARGVLGELSIYKRHFEELGYLQHPIAEGFDFTGPVWVQIKTTKVPENAYQMMKTAVNDLVDSSPPDKPMLLHILVREENAATNQLKSQIQAHINTLDPEVRDRFLLTKIETFEFIP